MSSANASFARLFSGLLFAAGLLFSTHAAAQNNGGIEWHEWDVIVDPAGADKHVATVWYGDNGDSIWQTAGKVDAGELGKGIELVWVGEIDPPTGLNPSYTAQTLTSPVTINNVHGYERPSDSSTDMVIDLVLESSCSTDCLVTDLDLVIFPDTTLDLAKKPSGSGFTFDPLSSFVCEIDDVVETHAVDQAI